MDVLAAGGAAHEDDDLARGGAEALEHDVVLDALVLGLEDLLVLGRLPLLAVRARRLLLRALAPAHEPVVQHAAVAVRAPAAWRGSTR